MLRQIRQNIIKNLWNDYRARTLQIQIIEKSLKEKELTNFLIDHFAMIDLPGPNTGIPSLQQIFSATGYFVEGSDYLSSKQNDFSWMREADCLNAVVTQVLPQVVVADFRLDELPQNIRKIILKYSRQAKPAPLVEIKQFIESAVSNNDSKCAQVVINLICHYLAGRDWPLPTIQEFFTVHEFNELLAWVLIFGRRPNHFTLPIHLFSFFQDLNHFNEFVESDLGIALNRDGGMIKGGKQVGIAQSSTKGIEQKLKLQDGYVNLRTDFVEFVWRYPIVSSQSKPEDRLWNDFFTGFVAENANHVIESLINKID